MWGGLFGGRSVQRANERPSKLFPNERMWAASHFGSSFTRKVGNMSSDSDGIVVAPPTLPDSDEDALVCDPHSSTSSVKRQKRGDSSSHFASNGPCPPPAVILIGHSPDSPQVTVD